MQTSKQKLEDRIKSAISKQEYLCIVISIKGNIEYIVNEPKYLQDKLEYYLNAYDDNLKLKTCNTIKIAYIFTGDKDKLLEFLSGKFEKNGI